MAFLVNCSRCTLTPAQCNAIVNDWRAVCRGQAEDVRARALGQLAAASPGKLAVLGIADIEYARGWVAAPLMASGLALSLLLLEHMTPLPPLPPTVWSDMYHHGDRIGLPRRLAKLAAHGPRLVDWLATIAQAEPQPPEPPDAHIGGWAPGRAARRLIPRLRPPGTDAAHDAIRRTLAGLDDNDWLMVSIDT